MMKKILFIFAVSLSTAQAGIVSIGSNHQTKPVGFFKWCGSLVRSLVVTPEKLKALSAFPDGAVPFLAEEINAKPEDRTHLLIYADWREETYGGTDSFMRYLRASHKAATSTNEEERATSSDEAWRLVDQYGIAWFSDWNRFFGRAEFSVGLRNAWVRSLSFSSVTDWDRLANGLRQFIDFYPFVEGFHFTLQITSDGRVTTVRSADITTADVKAFLDRPEQPFYQFVHDHSHENTHIQRSPHGE